MSWLLGAVNVPNSVILEARGLIDQTPSLFIRDASPTFLVAAGGLPATCRHVTSSDGSSGWAVTGIGLQQATDHCAVLDDRQWHQLLSTPELNTASIGGHFVIARWDRKGIHCYTDSLGVRTLYFKRVENGVVFSTRLDWIARLTHSQEIDFRVFGAQWLTFNQLNEACPLYDLERLPAGGHLYINRTGYSRTQITPWSPTWRETGIDDFKAVLGRFSNPRLPGNTSLSLGLSGGLDSRLLLAFTLDKSPAIHTFGPSTSPDVQIASTIAHDLLLEHRIIHEAIPDESECLRLLNEHVLHSHAITTASASLGLRYFDRLQKDGLAMIDGGFGEIARRQFLNRLLIRGKKQLTNKDYETALRHLYTPRPPIFNKGTQRALHEGALEQFINQWQSLPSQNEIGLENKLDLFSIRTRLPNFFGYEQNRLDGYILNYMPFAQIPVLECTLGLRLNQRRNGRIIRSLIRRMHKPLTRYPLAKGSTRVAFSMPPLMATGLNRLRKQLKHKPNPQQQLFLQRLRPFILDTLHSRDVREYEAYDYPLIEEKITSYFKGQSQHAGFLDWWLSFEVWRQQLGKPLT